MAKLLLDANISWRLAAKIKEIFPGSIHVNNIGIALPPTDGSIWSYAIKNGLHILTQDEDFMEIAILCGVPPKIIWLRRGNCSTNEIADLLQSSLVEIQDFLNDTAQSVIEIR